MSADETFGAPIVEQIDGREVSFPRLYMDFYGTLEGVVRNAGLAVERSALDDARVTGKERADAMAAQGRRAILPEDVDVYLATESGTRKTLTKSLEVAGVAHADIAGILNQIDFPRANTIARLVMGFLRPVPAQTDQSKVEDLGPPKARDWDSEYALIVKHIEGAEPSKLTWHQYHLCLARSQASERVEQSKA